MTVALAITPASGSVISTRSACRIDVTGATANDNTAYSTSVYPQSPAITYYLTFEKASVILGKSYVFTPTTTGLHSFMDYIFPSAGAWTVRLSKVAGDASVATAAVTVS